MKSILAIVVMLFAVNTFAAEAAKSDVKPTKSDVKPTKSDAKAPAAQADKKAAAPAGTATTK